MFDPILLARGILAGTTTLWHWRVYRLREQERSERGCAVGFHEWATRIGLGIFKPNAEMIRALSEAHLNLARSCALCRFLLRSLAGWYFELGHVSPFIRLVLPGQ